MRQRLVTLLTALSFLVLAVTGVLAFIRPFSIELVGLHALTGFLFTALAVFHAFNSRRPLVRHLRSRALWTCLAVTAGLTALLWIQPGPVRALLGLSRNLGPAQERFELSASGLRFHYTPAPHYKMALTVKTATGWDPENPPHFAIWLENQGAYHIKSLHVPDPEHAERLPYWHFKRRGWEKAKREAAADPDREVDGVSAATPNGSFDPADYILPADPDEPMPYKLLLEIDQPGDAHGPFDDQPSLVYAVEIDNALPRTFQLLDIVGYPKRVPEEGKEAWALYYVDDRFGSALDLVDSALLTIERGTP